MRARSISPDQRSFSIIRIGASRHGVLVIGPQQEHRVKQVVPVGEDVRGDEKAITDHALHGVTSPVDLGRNALDHDAAPVADGVSTGLGIRGHRGDGVANAGFRGGHR